MTTPASPRIVGGAGSGSDPFEVALLRATDERHELSVSADFRFPPSLR